MLEAIKNGIERLRKDQHTFTIVNGVLALLIAATAAIATIAQAWVSASQVSPLPQVQARSISELRIQIQDRRKTLEGEIKQLDELLKDIGRAEAVLSGASSQTPASAADAWWLSALKTLAVYLVLGFTV